jgi:hypothetical protein
MQLRLVFRGEFPKLSYLRILDEYWIEGIGLGDMVARVPLRDKQGMSRLSGILGRRQRERLMTEIRERQEGEEELREQGGMDQVQAEMASLRI